MTMIFRIAILWLFVSQASLVFADPREDLLKVRDHLSNNLDVPAYKAFVRAVLPSILPIDAQPVMDEIKELVTERLMLSSPSPVIAAFAADLGLNDKRIENLAIAMFKKHSVIEELQH